MDNFSFLHSQYEIMVQFCIVNKYGIDAYPMEYDEYFMFYDTISDRPMFFEDEFLFEDMDNFMLYAGKELELDRYTGKIPEKFGNKEQPT